MVRCLVLQLVEISIGNLRCTLKMLPNDYQVRKRIGVARGLYWNRKITRMCLAAWDTYYSEAFCPILCDYDAVRDRVHI
jgi:hypothetical protein